MASCITSGPIPSIGSTFPSTLLLVSIFLHGFKLAIAALIIITTSGQKGKERRGAKGCTSKLRQPPLQGGLAFPLNDCHSVIMHCTFAQGDLGNAVFLFVFKLRTLQLFHIIKVLLLAKRVKWYWSGN